MIRVMIFAVEHTREGSMIELIRLIEIDSRTKNKDEVDQTYDLCWDVQLIIQWKYSPSL